MQGYRKEFFEGGLFSTDLFPNTLCRKCVKFFPKKGVSSDPSNTPFLHPLNNTHVLRKYYLFDIEVDGQPPTADYSPAPTPHFFFNPTLKLTPPPPTLFKSLLIALSKCLGYASSGHNFNIKKIRSRQTTHSTYLVSIHLL